MKGCSPRRSSASLTCWRKRGSRSEMRCRCTLEEAARLGWIVEQAGLPANRLKSEAIGVPQPVCVAPYRRVVQMRVCSRHALQSQTKSFQSLPDSICCGNAALRRDCDWTPPFIELTGSGSRYASRAARNRARVRPGSLTSAEARSGRSTPRADQR
jgi:hypothetical protein